MPQNLAFDLKDLCEKYHKARTENSPSLAEDLEMQINELVTNHLPHGAGFDRGTQLFLGFSTSNKLIFGTQFHHLDEHGNYTEWTRHQITVLCAEDRSFSLKVSGPNKNEIKDYIFECFYEALTSVKC